MKTLVDIIFSTTFFVGSVVGMGSLFLILTAIFSQIEDEKVIMSGKVVGIFITSVLVATISALIL